MILHLLYNDKNGKFHPRTYRDFPTIKDAEKYLEKIKAKYWEVGIKFSDIKKLDNGKT